ncbi:MAG: FxLYD domain-containing protein [Omnitrophica WOR_2 bacterium]
MKTKKYLLAALVWVACFVFLFYSARAIDNPYSYYFPFVVKSGDTPQPTQPSGEVSILSHNAYVPYEGSNDLYIVGEVKNNTNSNIGFVSVKATLRDSSGTLVDVASSYTMVSTLSPGEKSPFQIMFFYLEPWTSYELSVNWDTTAQVSYPLMVLSVNKSYDPLGDFHLVGEVVNQYSEPRTWVKAVATLYDMSGNVIGAETTYVDPYDLDPGQTATFDILAMSWKGKNVGNLVGTFTLQAYSD